MQWCSLLCRSLQRVSFPPPQPPSYAGRPIISSSLGIDQRAGESPLWGREREMSASHVSKVDGEALRTTRQGYWSHSCVSWQISSKNSFIKKENLKNLKCKSIFRLTRSSFCWGCETFWIFCTLKHTLHPERGLKISWDAHLSSNRS